MVNEISDTEQVKVIVQQFSMWIPVISTLTGGILAGGVAVVVSLMNHRYAREREASAAEERRHHEQQLAEDNHQKELLYIATELIFILEMFVDECAKVASDNGEPDHHGEYFSSTKQPELMLSDISGDWRTLPPLVMYRIRELPVLQNEARREITVAAEHAWAPFHTEWFQERQYQYTRLGLKALILSLRLRKLTRLPGTRLDATEWSAQPVLWTVWRKERERRMRFHVQRQQAYSAFKDELTGLSVDNTES